MKRAAIIIVNWNGKKFLEDCLSSVYKQTYKNFDVYFVDNHSSDDSVKFVKKNFFNTKIIQLDKNYGFAKGNNEGIKEAFKNKSVEYIVCLNNDTIVDKNWLKELVKTVKKDRKIGAVGSKLVYWSKKDRINTMGVIPLKNGNALNLYKNELSNKHIKEERIFGPCAGSAIYKRELLERIGLFDESYFCYLEDVDLDYRINKEGYYCIANPKSKVIHIHSGTSSKNNKFKWFLINRNSLLNSYKHLGWYNFLFYPFITFRYYKKFLKEENIKKQVQDISKLELIRIIFRAYPSALKIILGGRLKNVQ